jgi:tricorn protease
VTIYEADADEPGVRSPMRDAHVDMSEGDVIEQVNGVSTLSVEDIAMLLRQKAGRQVLLRVQPTQGGAGAKPAARDVVIKPLNPGEETELRYRSWEVRRRQLVEQWSNGRIGYVHLRAMGTGDIGDFARDYYPVFNREGLIMDVRDNGGGNIDSWILSRLMRKAWMYWNQHAGQAPSWNMQYAFRGHMAALCNERTGSDGEAFAEGFKRLNLGKVIGTRTWGGEIWLSSSNVLVDNGLASAGEYGVFGPEGTWLVEGHGVDPDIVVDNLPHATFMGEDAQLKAAVDHLLEKLAKEPIPAVVVPKTPDKSQKSEK